MVLMDGSAGVREIPDCVCDFEGYRWFDGASTLDSAESGSLMATARIGAAAPSDFGPS
jgi:hypothetical protein